MRACALHWLLPGLLAACDGGPMGGGPDSGPADGGATGDGAMSCPPGPAVQDAPADPHPVFPEPRYAKIGPLGARVRTACVDLSALGFAHAALEARVADLLLQAGLEGAPAPATACACDFALTFAASPPALPAQASAVWAAAGSSAERHLALTESQDGRARATLYAASERGALYALRAALALVQPDPAAPTARRVATATIVDFPGFAGRGVVEGFYGPPYSVTDRTTLLRLQDRLRENAFIYGPKNDPYARDQWRDPYPLTGTGAGAGQVIQVAAHEADRLLVDFIWSISPGLSYDFANDAAEFARLTAKIENLRSLGVRRFALFLDDIGSANATQHADLINRTADYLRSRDAQAHLIVVGTRYAFGPDAYTDTLGQRLHPDIEVMWTGNDIEPATMTAADMGAVNRSLRRSVTIWDNWPNAPGSFTGRSADLHAAVAGYYSNPVLNEQAAHPPAVFWQVLGAISDYLWDPERYAPDPGSSFQRWQPILSRWLPQVAPCSPCGSFGAGWTCSPTDRNTIYYCDGRCLTGLPCPGDCQLQPNPHPDICR
ncbi:MAG TPA: beta-N-acetylglucosaminidase domain-containing protein [Polyangia bacterium]|nr:beta-N-acetylglucosaminidase domain-containing protein [Polyangia bacterium]